MHLNPGIEQLKCNLKATAYLNLMLVACQYDREHLLSSIIQLQLSGMC